MPRPYDDRPSEGKARKRGAYTVRRRLVILAAVLTLPPLVATAVLLDYIYQRERTAAELQLRSTALTLMLMIDRQFGQIGVQLRTLATSTALKANDFDGFDRQVREAGADDGSWVTLFDMSGRQLVNTRLPRGASLPAVSLPNSRARVGREPPYVSDLIKSSPAGIAVVAVDIPIMRDGAMAYELVRALPASAFARILADQKLPSDWVAVVIDRKGVIVGRSHEPEKYLGISVPERYFAPLAAAPEGVISVATPVGEKVLFAYNHSQVTGWTLGVAIPAGEVGATARRSVYLVLAVGLAVFGVGAVAARRIARSITRPIEGLAQRAAALGHGTPIEPLGSGLIEADLAADALLRSAELLNMLTATLEQRVIDRTSDLHEANRRLSEEMEERRRTQEHLTRVQRMEAVGQLTGGVAHDFNNLLQVVIGNLDLLRQRIVDKPSQRMVDHALLAAERGAKLTVQLLAFSRRQHIEPGAVDANALVSGLRDMLRSTLGSTIRLDNDLKEGLWPALADVTQLELMILNLVINARDAMPNGGRILIRTRDVVRQEPQKPEEPGPGEYVELTVSDDGDGIRPEVLSRVFEPFFTTKPVGKGSGLGLSQVLGLAQQQGGGITIDSAPGRGTEVRLYLPRAAEKDDADAVQPL